jgi:glycosyltransferase involved in cell wall biosynthesis
MRVLHVVTLVTPDGAFGGPTRVAVNLCSALRHQGHDAIIAAGVRGFDESPSDLDGVPAFFFPARPVIAGFGYAPTRAPALGRWLDEHAPKFDIVHVHLARDLVTIPTAAKLRRLRIPFVVQTHGMITPYSHPLAMPIDRLWTARLLRSAARVLHLNQVERHDLCTVGGSELRFRQLSNGVPAPTAAATGLRSSALPEVLFFARLHERKRPEVFAEAALSVLRSGIRAQFAIVGPAEGADVSVDAIIAQARAEGFGEDLLRREPAVPPHLASARMAGASVYVLPAVREPFGMTVVEALMLGIPVIICADAGLADFVRTHACGLVVDGSTQSFTHAISDLLSDPDLARSMGQRGPRAVESTFSIAAIARELEQIYAEILDQVSA